MLHVFNEIVFVFIMIVSAFHHFAKKVAIPDNKLIKLKETQNMKKLLLTIIEQIENQGNYIPFDSVEPIKTNSQN